MPHPDLIKRIQKEIADAEWEEIQKELAKQNLRKALGKEGKGRD